MALADKLEREERARREREPVEIREEWAEEDRRKRARVEAAEREAEARRLRALAEAEVARRLAAER